MSKSRDAFRTISEVSDALDTPAHVLRFWESKFSQVKPVKRAGGRRYYRPTDVDLLAGIKQLLHDDGMTIKGAQKLLREKGVKHVGALGAAVLDANVEDIAPVDVTPVEPAQTPETPADVVADAPPAPAPSEPELNITNVVPLATPNVGPSLSLNLAPKPAEPADAAPQDAPTPPAAPSPDIPADPSDSDSKAPARIFHLLHKAPPEKLAPHGAKIALLLDRMKILRHRITAR